MHFSSIRKKRHVPQTFIQHGIVSQFVTLVQKKRSVPQVMPEPANMGESNDPCEKEICTITHREAKGDAAAEAKKAAGMSGESARTA